MLHLEGEWPSKQNNLIADMILTEPGSQPGFKVWGEKYIFRGKYFYHMFNPFSLAKAPNLAEICNPITRQAIELESYPNHPWIQQVL